MDKWKSGTLTSGGSSTPVKSQAQAVAIMLSEKRAAQKGKSEYQPRSVMGRKVIHHSPDQHPQQDDPMASYTIFQQDMARPPMRQAPLKMGPSYTSPAEVDKAVEELKKSNPGSVIYSRKGGKA
jgi:hypothetical protein